MDRLTYASKYIIQQLSSRTCSTLHKRVAILFTDLMLMLVVIATQMSEILQLFF